MEYQTLNSLNDASSQKIVINRIKRIIEKYEDVWRVLHEPIQNSIDAIQKRDDISEGKVYLKIEIKSGKVIIKDNGRGFPKNLKLLLPDGTDKSEQSDTMGYQGVGLKSVIYSSNKFYLVSNTGEDFWGIEILNAAQYLRTEGEEQAPIRETQENRIEQGTTMEIDFDANLVINAIERIIDTITNTESNFKWQLNSVKKLNHFLSKASNLQDEFQYILKYYLLTQAYIGSVSRLLNCRLKQSDNLYAKKVDVDIDIDFSGLQESDTENKILKSLIRELNGERTSSKKIISLNVENKFIDFREITEQIKNTDSRSISFEIYDFFIIKGGRIGNPSLIDQVYCKVMTPNYMKDEDDTEGRYAEYISLIDPGSQDRKNENVKHFKSLFPKILGIYILIGRLEYFTKYLGNNYGMKFIAANGIPTQHELTARSSNQSFYFNPITFILNIDGKLNEGKTHLVSDYLKKRCVEFFREAFESTLNRLAKEFVRTIPNTDNPVEADLVSLNKINIDGVDIKREPVDEDTLIALFYQIIKIKDFKLPTYGLLRQGIFDGKFAYDDSNIRSNNDLLNLEFKVKLPKLLDDFDSPSSGKTFEDCDLIIVWNAKVSKNQDQDWRVVERSAVPTRGLRGAKYPEWITVFLKDRNQNYKPLIIVEEWVSELDKEFSNQA